MKKKDLQEIKRNQEWLKDFLSREIQRQLEFLPNSENKEVDAKLIKLLQGYKKELDRITDPNQGKKETWV